MPCAFALERTALRQYHIVTMQTRVITGLLLIFVSVASLRCKENDAQPAAPAPLGWDVAKAEQLPINQLSAEFNIPEPQGNRSLAWEDGTYISRDGLSMYSFYVQYDALKWTFDGAVFENWPLYKRGPSIGQDFSNPVPGFTFEWLHADVAMSHRSSTSAAFPAWNLSNLRNQHYNLGAPQGVIDPLDSTKFELFVHTSDNPNKGKIRLLRNVSRDLAAPGTLLPANVNEVAYHIDNPHIERLSATSLILFFDSEDKPGTGDRDMWFTTSGDDGTTWTNAANVSSANITGYDAQPHLFHDGTIWWLYYSQANPADGKAAIYRARQGTPGNWNSWTSKELVISAGTSAGLGEPSLTTNGDIAFCVVVENKVNPTQYDKFDNDTWMMKKK